VWWVRVKGEDKLSKLPGLYFSLREANQQCELLLRSGIDFDIVEFS
jgi:hypothetical protein